MKCIHTVQGTSSLYTTGMHRHSLFSFCVQVVCSKLFVPVDPASSKHMRSSHREHRRFREAPQRRSKNRISCTQQSGVTELGTEEVEGPPVAEKTPVVELSWDDDMNDDILKMLIARATFYEKAIR